MMWSLYEIIHIWTADVDESEEWLSQLIFQFKQFERRMIDHSSLSSTSAVQIWIISYKLHIMMSLLTGEMNSINWPRSQRVAS